MRKWPSELQWYNLSSKNVQSIKSFGLHMGTNLILGQEPVFPMRLGAIFPFPNIIYSTKQKLQGCLTVIFSFYSAI